MTEMHENSFEDWRSPNSPTREELADRLAQITIAADAYMKDPVNANDRPQSWAKLGVLLDACDRHGSLAELREMLRAAVLAERERCAGIADAHASFHHSVPDDYPEKDCAEIACAEAEAIAAEIRRAPKEAR